MKLIQNLNRQYITYSFIVLVIVGVALFFTIKSIVDEETDEKLVNTFKQIELLINNNPQTFDLYPVITVKQVAEYSNKRYFTDTTLNVKNEWEEYRQLVGYSTIQNINYKIIVREAGIESDDLMETMVVIIILGFSILLLSLFIINKRIAKKIWSPFFDNLDKLKRFSLQSLIPFKPTKTITDEFNEMNEVLKSLTNKVISDYDNLKKFSENASHELQTPLAIIRSKIEAILEENTLSPSQVEKIQTIYQTVNRLSKINSGLVLLTKIENRQFTGHKEISFNEIIKTQMENFSELIEMKELELNYQCIRDWKITGDKTLIEMLVNNLFGNTILHNTQKGKLIIELDNHLIKLSNTSSSNSLESDKLFERFYKSGTTGSTGLGLAISKQICNSLRLNIAYHFEKPMHFFIINEKK